MERYQESERHLERAERTIPLGSQTFSKSRTQYPVGISPLYVTRAKGAEIWDVDGNRYIDLVSSLASVTLGYADREVEFAVKKQLRNGVTLSLPGKIESEVAELIVDLVPSAEMVRFGKNGTDATSAAVRLARAYTGTEHVAVCGYHGWQDWYIGSTTRNKGVPRTVSDLTHNFVFNDIDSLQSLIARFPNMACVVMEPMNVEFPKHGFLEEVRRITTEKGIVLVFDETITGFRFSRGGAQELFKVTPDLSTFGKGIANGFPLSAVVGKREIMQEMEEIFFSGTFGGELLSLAAARVVLTKHTQNAVCENLNEIGTSLNVAISELIRKHKMEDVLKTTGHPTWQFLTWSKDLHFDQNQIKTYFLQEAFKQGLLVLNSHNVNLKHTKKMIDKISGKYDHIFGKIVGALENESLMNQLLVPPLKPLFTIR